MKLKIKNKALLFQLSFLIALTILFLAGTIVSIAKGASHYAWIILPFAFIACIVFTVVWDFKNIFEICHENVKTETPDDKIKA